MRTVTVRECSCADPNTCSQACGSEMVDRLYVAAEVTDEMVERAAISLRNFEAYDRSGMEPVDTLDKLLEPDYYRELAWGALAAALTSKEKG